MNELDLRGNKPHSEVMIIQGLVHGSSTKFLLASGPWYFNNESFISQITE